METAIRRTVGGAALLVLVLVAACGGKSAADAESQHCEKAFERITKEVRARTLVSVRNWSVGDNKNIAITYDGIFGNTDTPLRDTLTCTYLVPVGAAPVKKSRIDAIDIVVRGKHLGAAELLLLNTAIQVSRVKLF